MELLQTTIGQPSSWRASGDLVSYRGKRMLLTTSTALGECDDEYEIIKWDIPQEDQDDEDGLETEAKETQRSVPGAGEDDGLESSSLSYPEPLRDPFLPNELPFMRPQEFNGKAQELIGRAKPIIRVDKLDYALIDVTEITSARTPVAIALNDRDKIVAHCEEHMKVITVTPGGGRIQGSRMPSLWEVRLPGKNEDLQVYAARLCRSLGPGYMGSWVWDEQSHKLLGHIIIVRFFEGSEVALIVPAIKVFEHASREVDLLN